MSSRDYKKIALEHFYNKDFKNAKLFFNLAYQKRKNKKLLNLIALCDFALSSSKEAFVLLDFYLKHYYHPKIDKDFEQILALHEAKRNFQDLTHEDESSTLSYEDFLQSEKKIGFKKSFENVIFANKLVINDKEDFLDFLEKLLDYGYKETTLNYIELTSFHFYGNERFEKLAKKLKEEK
ncbi:histidine kinase [Campylobacter sp. MIT 99-7217]|uniref:histidine kinase n=1 Tax=Campylobacter sp. MIT 99-7217 TaxID=535091 RepID=UPI001157F37B|nr:histidine kinase [Campylobacter sp. MIT 99-7217]TQR32350.1 histidine kinase [Campylobacter sp. MIT 99-7217]